MITLTPDPANPNRLDSETKAAMARSLAEFGDLSGIILNRRTGMLIGSHQRTDVLRDGQLRVKDLPAPEPDGTVARGHLECNGRRYTVRVVDWSEDKAHAALLAANRFGRLGQDDAALLKDLLQELDTGAMDMDLTGYTAEDIEELLTDETQKDATAEIFSQSVQLEPGCEFLVIKMTPQEYEDAKEALELKQVRRGGYRSGSAFDSVGWERCIEWERVRNAIRNTK